MKPKSALALFLAIPVVMIGLMDLGSYSPKPIGRPDTLRIFIPYGPDTMRALCETKYEKFGMRARLEELIRNPLFGSFVAGTEPMSPGRLPGNVDIVPYVDRPFYRMFQHNGMEKGAQFIPIGGYDFRVAAVFVANYAIPMLDSIRARGDYSQFPGWFTIIFSAKHAEHLRENPIVDYRKETPYLDEGYTYR